MSWRGLQKFCGAAARRFLYVVGRAAGDDFAASLAAVGAHVYYVVGVFYDVEVVLNYDDRRAVFDELLEDSQQRLHVERVKPDCGLVENEDGVRLPFVDFLREF